MQGVRTDFSNPFISQYNLHYFFDSPKSSMFVFCVLPYICLILFYLFSFWNCMKYLPFNAKQQQSISQLKPVLTLASSKSICLVQTFSVFVTDSSLIIGSWIYSYMCKQCLSPLRLWIRTLFMARCTRYNIMCSSLSMTCDRSVVSSTNKTDRHNIIEILLNVALNTII